MNDWDDINMHDKLRAIELNYILVNQNSDKKK